MWRLWAIDYFDTKSPPFLEMEGNDPLSGFEALWRKTLEEGVQDDGRPTFTWFRLELMGAVRRSISVPRDPLANRELARLRGLRHDSALLRDIAIAHSLHAGAEDIERILSAVRTQDSDNPFHRIPE